MRFDDDCEPKVAQEYTTNMINMSSRCPRLEELHIFPQHPNYLDTTQLLERGSLAFAQEFYVAIHMSDDANRMLDAFLEAHPLLERLYITGHVAPNNRVWTVSLQNLMSAVHVVSMRNMTKISFSDYVAKSRVSFDYRPQLETWSGLPGTCRCSLKFLASDLSQSGPPDPPNNSSFSLPR